MSEVATSGKIVKVTYDRKQLVIYKPDLQATKVEILPPGESAYTVTQSYGHPRDGPTFLLQMDNNENT